MDIWAKWNAWAVWGEGAGGAPTYTISGTINDSAGAGLDGVTVTLTGDASDSVVTAGGGAYEFTGLVAGAYTVTPTKAGNTFLPASANVTIVGANKTATTMAQVWQITGTIVDGADVGISGVLVTLGGDASDTDTTDGNGDYSFPGLSNGNYTLTPTKTDSTFYPTSSAEIVTDADIDSDFVGTEWLLYDEFTTAESAPITSPRTCEPGPGTVTIVDTGNKFDITGEELVISTITGSGDPGFHGDLSGDISVRTPGLAAFQRIYSGSPIANRVRFGLEEAWDVSPDDSYVYKEGALLSGQSVDIDPAFFVLNTYYEMTVVVRSVGHFIIADGVLAWVNNVDLGILDTLVWSPNTSATDLRCAKVGALSLPANGYAEWDADFSTVTDTKTNPASGTTLDVDADHSYVCSFTVEDGSAVQVFSRYVDNTHYGMMFRVLSNRAPRLAYNIGGGDQILWTGSQRTDAVSYKFDLVVEGAVAKLYIDNVLQTPVAAANYQDITGGKVVHDLITNDIELSTHPLTLGIATDRVIAPQEDDTYSHSADFLAYIRNVTLPSSGTMEFQFRISGADEVTLQLGSDGSIVLLDNADTEISAGAATVTDADDIALICEGSDGQIFVANMSIGTTSTIAVVAGTAGKRSDATDGICDSIELFPRDVFGLLPSELV